MIIKKLSKTNEQIITDLLDQTILDEESFCMVWKRATSKDGYPRIAWKGNQNTRVNRLMAELKYNKDISTFIVRHTCDNKKCINPEHLILGSVLENINDRVVRGRTFKHVSEEKFLRIKELLALNKLTYKEIAIIVGVHRNTVQKFNRKLNK